MAPNVQTSSFSTAGIFKGAILGGLAAMVACEALYFGGLKGGATFLLTPPNAPPMVIPPFMPIVNCTGSALGAAVVMSGLARVVPTRAWAVFLAISVVVFLGFDALPLLVIANDTVGLVMLELMHVVAAVAVVGGISRWGRVGA